MSWAKLEQPDPVVDILSKIKDELANIGHLLNELRKLLDDGGDDA